MPTIVFDFDGTIADTMSVVVKIANKFADHYGYRKIPLDDIPKLREKKPSDVLKHLGISIFKLPIVARKIRFEMNKEIVRLHATAEIRDTLVNLKKKGCVLGILTTNSRENVMEFLKNNDLQLFDFVYTGRAVYGKSRLLKKLMKEKTIPHDDPIYVGDEIRDVEAAKKAGIRVIGVSWGYNTKNALQKANPDHIVEKPKDLEQVILDNSDLAR
ncbi:MAG TPA: HAD hydrolase-like protein [Candidatus Nitrosotalea sp.]|nr:HAD hydrolase-like protein [Nitrososphaerota archaeon]HKU33194.1 HAD hydrolase-like protein [Candidatus Nitrosotalea sp.]